MYYKTTLYLLLSILVVGAVTACQLVLVPPAEPVAAYPSDVATDWFELELKLIKETPGFTPPVAARALGYSGITLYESVVNGMPNHNSLVGQLHELNNLPQPNQAQTYHWGAVANSALATINRNLFPTAAEENLTAIDLLEQQYAAQYEAELDPELFARSVVYGYELATAIFDWSKSDGGHEGYATNFPGDYTPPTGTGLWVSTPPDFQTALQPYWGDNRPFVLESGEECSPPPATAYSEDPSSAFYAEAMEVYTAVQDLTPEEEAIALFWADDPGKTFTPPGHAISIATQVLYQEEATLELAAETYARVGIAVSDAFIGCWYAKYVHNLIRPISYIQTFIDPTWNTPNITDPVITPPFPEYPSGHSTQSGASAAVLTAVFGDNYSFIDDTHHAAGMAARTFASFNAAADEAAISRLYGGIHYRPAIELGVEQGRCIGEKVNALAWHK